MNARRAHVATVRPQGTLALAIALVVGCSAAASRAPPAHELGHTAATLQSRSLKSAPAELGAPRATISLVATTCAANDLRDWLHFFPEAGVVWGECKHRPWGAWVGPTGSLVEDHRPMWGAPGGSVKDAPGLFRRIAGRAWLARIALEDNGAAYKYRLTIAAHDDHGWSLISDATCKGSERIVGLGPWPGGAVIAAVQDGADLAGPTLRVLEGHPSAPLPRIPANVGAHFDFATTESGEAFGSWEVPDGGGTMMLLHWARGVVDPRVDVLAGVRSPTPLLDDSKFFIRAPSEVYVFAAHGAEKVNDRSVKVLRFDGATWRTSFEFASTTGVTGATLTPDGAFWVVVAFPGSPAGEPRTELWRRRPGGGDRWEHIALDALSPGSDLRASEVMPAGHRDVFLAGELVGTGLGVYRVHLEDP